MGTHSFLLKKEEKNVPYVVLLLVISSFFFFYIVISFGRLVLYIYEEPLVPILKN